MHAGQRAVEQEREKKKMEKEKKTENRVRLFYTSVASPKRYFYFSLRALLLPSSPLLSSALGKLHVVIRKEFSQCVRYSPGSISCDDAGVDPCVAVTRDDEGWVVLESEIITNGTVFLIISSLTSRQKSPGYPILSTRPDAVS